MTDNGNGILLINKKLCPAGLKNNPNRTLTAIKAVVIHTTANRAATATAKSHATYQFNGSEGREASWHYTVDDSEIWQSFNDNQMCWHCGNADGNETSIGIEICVNAGAEKFKAACKLAVKLTAEVLRRNKLTVENVKQHYDYAKKDCPAELRSGEWGVTWADFITFVKDHLAALDEMLSFGKTTPSTPPTPATSTPPTKTPIMGASVATAEQLATLLLQRNPAPKLNAVSPVDLARYYLQEGEVEGVRGDVAFCQALWETGNFAYGNLVQPEQNNFCGLGATGATLKDGTKERGLSFKTAQEGVQAHIQHLKAYASKEPLFDVCVDKRFSLVTRGIAPNWEDLDGRWAVPGVGYGANIIKLWNAAKAIATPAPLEMTVTDAIAELVRFGIIQSPEYWLSFAESMKYLDLLLIKTAQKLIELDAKL